MESPSNEETKSQLAISCHQMKPPMSGKGYIKFFFQKVLGQSLIIKTLLDFGDMTSLFCPLPKYLLEYIIYTYILIQIFFTMYIYIAE